MKLFFIIIIIVFGWASVCTAVRQNFTFYTDLGCTGEGLILHSKQPDVRPEAPRIVSTFKSLLITGLYPYPSVDIVGKNVLAKKKCYVAIKRNTYSALPVKISLIVDWVLYPTVNYTTDRVWNNGGEYNWCFNYSNPNIQSIRYLGPPDTTTNSLSLYQSVHFGGQEVTITGPAFNTIPFVPKSLFSTGNTSWTFYTGSNFDGVATCFTPTPDTSTYPHGNGWWYFLGGLSPALSNVKSITRGCNCHS